MPRAVWTGFVVGLAVATLVASGVQVGCSSDHVAASSPDAQAVCPATVAASIGGSCVTGLTCYPEYACDITTATAACLCKAGRFSCTDAVGNALDSSSTPACPPPADAAGKCPGTETSANLAPCTEPGLICPYPSPCASIPAYDQCQCFDGPMRNGQVGLRFECESTCSPDSGPVAVPDSGGGDAGSSVDGGLDGASADGSDASEASDSDASD